MSARTQEIIARLHALDAERRQVMKLMQAPVFRDTQQQSHLERLLIGLQLESEGLASQLQVHEEAAYPEDMATLRALEARLSESINRRAVDVSKARRTGQKR